MPSVSAVSIFPSVKFITTNAKGDLAEVIAQDAIAAGLEIESVLNAEAKTPGVAGNLITVSLSFSGTNGDPISYSVTGNNIVITVPPTTNGGVQTPIAIASDFASNAPTDATDLIKLETAAGITNADVLSGNDIAPTNLTGGADESTVSDLEKSSKYVCIKTTDLHDLEVSEEADGRKLIWGFLNKAAEIFASLSTQPDNLKISKSVPSSADNGTSLKQVYTITSKYGVSNLDLKDES